MISRALTLLIFGLGAGGLGACTSLSDSVMSPSHSVSASLEAIANALGGASNSISRSSGSGGASHALDLYTRDVSAFTVACVQQGTSEADFLRGLGRVAREHGYVRWEAEPQTVVAIGRGLRYAVAKEHELSALRAHLAEHAPEALDLLLAGWSAPATGA
ncbi:MAG: putative lipoprotein [Planctomycetota bacterium]